jgi:hypothetical protein
MNVSDIHVGQVQVVVVVELDVVVELEVEEVVEEVVVDVVVVVELLVVTKSKNSMVRGGITRPILAHWNSRLPMSSSGLKSRSIASPEE